VVSANPEYVRTKVEGKLTVGVVSINKANTVLFTKKTQLHVGDDAWWPVFIPGDRGPSSQLRSFLNSSALHAAVERLLESKDDSLHVFQGAVVLYSKARDADEVMGKIETLAKLVGPFHRRDNATYLNTLPLRFHRLIPWILKWAESDDQERNALLDKSSTGSLGELVKVVAPDLDEIDRYLDSFQDEPMPEAATALGRLAELVAEAELRLSTEGPAES